MKKRMTVVCLCVMALTLFLAGCTTTPTPTASPKPTATPTAMPTATPAATPSASPEASPDASPDAAVTPDASASPAASPDAAADFDTENLDVTSNGNIARAVDRIQNAPVPGIVQSDKITDLKGEGASGFLGAYVSLEGSVKTIAEATEEMGADAAILEAKGQVITLTVEEDEVTVYYIGKDTITKGDTVTVFGYYVGSKTEPSKETVILVSDRVEKAQ